MLRSCSPFSHSYSCPCNHSCSRQCSHSCSRPCSHSCSRPCSHPYSCPCSHSCSHPYSHSCIHAIGGRKGAVDERLHVVQINIGRTPSGGSKNFNLREFTYNCLKVLNGFIHFIANMAKEAILETSTDFYAVPAKTESAILSLWRANHINKYDHCKMYTQSKSQFTWDFNSTKALLHLTDLTFQDSLDYEIVKQGFSYRQGEFYLYKFNVNRTTYHFLLVVDMTPTSYWKRTISSGRLPLMLS